MRKSNQIFFSRSTAILISLFYDGNVLSCERVADPDPTIAWYFNKMVLQNTLRSDVSAILKSIHVREIVLEFVWVKQW